MNLDEILDEIAESRGSGIQGSPLPSQFPVLGSQFSVSGFHRRFSIAIAVAVSAKTVCIVSGVGKILCAFAPRSLQLHP